MSLTEKQLASLILSLLSDHFDKECKSVLVEQNGSSDNWVSNRVELRGAYDEVEIFSLLVFKDNGVVKFYEEGRHGYKKGLEEGKFIQKHLNDMHWWGTDDHIT